MTNMQKSKKGKLFHSTIFLISHFAFVLQQNHSFIAHMIVTSDPLY